MMVSCDLMNGALVTVVLIRVHVVTCYTHAASVTYFTVYSLTVTNITIRLLLDLALFSVMNTPRLHVASYAHHRGYK